MSGDADRAGLDARLRDVVAQYDDVQAQLSTPEVSTDPDRIRTLSVVPDHGDVAANLPYDVRERGTTLPDLSKWTSWGGELFVFSL